MTVRQLRLVVGAEDYDAAVAFYRDVLGLPEQAAFATGDGGWRSSTRAGRRSRSPIRRRSAEAADGFGANG